MDGALKVIADFVADTDPASLAGSTVKAVTRRVVDSVGCGAGGFLSEPARMTRAVGRGVGGPLVASVYGESKPVLVDYAALANGTANRYLDFNDFGLSGHPSDMIPAMLAMAEATGASGAEAIAAIYIAYEIATVLAERVPPTGGWDQGIYSSLGVAGGLSKIMGLSRQQTAHALSLAIVPSVPLRVTRFGELSDWKAAAVPHATMTASLATRLAGEGMTGPPEPFEGRFGLFEQAWVPFKYSLGGVFPSAIERSSIKGYGACYWGQVAIDIAARLREEIDVSTIQSIDIATTDAAFRAIGGGVGDHAQKWRPVTRETADHSMPFLVASMLDRGVIDERTFEDLDDRARVGLMDRITVRDDAQLTGRSARDQCPTKFTITLIDGSTLSREQDVPKGHPLNPMSDIEVAEKSEAFLSRVLPESEARALSEAMWHLKDQGDLAAIGAAFRAFRGGGCRKMQ